MKVRLGALGLRGLEATRVQVPGGAALSEAARRATRLALGALALLPLAPFFAAQPPLAVCLPVAGLLALSVVTPSAGWLLLVGASPFGTLLGKVAGARWSVTEPLVLAFLAGWLVRQAVRPSETRTSSPQSILLALAGLFALAVTASLAVQLVVRQVFTAFPLAFVQYVWRNVWHDYYRMSAALQGIGGAALGLEALGVFAATIHMVVNRPARGTAAARVFVGAATGVSLVNLLRLGYEQWTAGKPFELSALLTARISYVFPDVNAAGSYLLMALVVAIGFALNEVRHRWAWTTTSILLLLGLWFSGSRTALVAGLLGAVAVGGAIWLSRGRRGARMVIPLVLGPLLLVGGFTVISNRTSTGKVGMAIGVRAEMAARALRMFRDAPVFGVGPANFYPLSLQYASTTGKTYYRRENAHNNFLQVLAELGLVGFCAFVALLAAALGLGLRASARSPLGRPLALGVVAFVATWFSGHPLLVREVGLAFWTMLGVFAMESDAREEPLRWARARRRVSVLVAAAVIVIATLVPLRIDNRLARADLGGAGRGLSAWHRDAARTPFRWMSDHAVFYVPAAAGRVRVPLRSPDGVATVRLQADGGTATQVLVGAGSWQPTDVEVPATNDRGWAWTPITIEVRGGGQFASPAHQGVRRLQVGVPAPVRKK